MYVYIMRTLTARSRFRRLRERENLWDQGTECITYHHEVHELDEYNQEFWNTSGYSLKCV